MKRCFIIISAMLVWGSAAVDIRFVYPGWKYKALTFSYDDGVIEDRRLVEIFNRYKMKCTFNVSAGRAGSTPRFIPLSEYAELYKGHEIASHGYKHLNMNSLDDAAMEKEIREDLVSLEKAVGYPVKGFAYPYGANSERVWQMLKKYGISYARTTGDSKAFSEPQNRLAMHPTAHHNNNLLAIGKKYREYKGWGGVLSICNIWGHSYEFERQGKWELIETFCREMADRPDIWYAANGEILDYLDACRKVRTAVDGSSMINPTSTTIYLYVDGKKVLLPPTSVPAEGLTVQATLPAGDYPLFPGGRTKALTFSYDDGNDMAGDSRLVQIFNQYKLKGTFNINGKRDVDYSIYKGHEVATHGFFHLTYRSVPFDLIVRDIYRDREALEKAVGYPVRGHAYPNGGWSVMEASENILAGCGIAYARLTAAKPESFAIPENWLQWAPTAHHENDGDIINIGKEFMATEKVPALCSIWGHSREFQVKKNWKIIEDFAALMSGKKDIWYAANIEIYDYMQAVAALRWSADRSFCKNMSAIPVYYCVQGKPRMIGSGEICRFND